MKFDVRYANHPDDSKKYDTAELREKYLIKSVFEKDDIVLTYSHQDRIIAGGIYPIKEKLSLIATKDLAADYFLQRRELGVINIGGPGYITLDGKKIEMAEKDGLYVGQGTKELIFVSNDPKNPAKFYMTSAPAHKSYKTVHIPFTSTNPNHLGSGKTLNERTIYQYVHPKVCESCQLAMGMTILNEGSSWNTMPCHTHERRMEVYLYFNMADDTRVFHMMGKPDETRHIVMANEQAVISPSWSIHSGVGTSDYTFIWAMCGENQEFTDMDAVEMSEIK